MPSTLIKQSSKFRCVTWSLVSKPLARTCTLQRSGESEGSKTDSTTPARWQRPWQRRPSLFCRSSAPQRRSRSGQLPRPGHLIIQKPIALRWNDLMTRFRSLDSKSEGHQFECSTWHHKSVELLVVSQLHPLGWNLHLSLKEAEYLDYRDNKLNSNWNCLCLQRVSAWDANVVICGKM